MLLLRKFYLHLVLTKLNLRKFTLESEILICICKQTTRNASCIVILQLLLVFATFYVCDVTICTLPRTGNHHTLTNLISCQCMRTHGRRKKFLGKGRVQFDFQEGRQQDLGQKIFHGGLKAS